MPATTSGRLRDRYELGALTSERAGVQRYRGIDHTTGEAVVIVAAPVIETALPVAEAAPIAEVVDDEIMPGFDDDIPLATKSVPTCNPAGFTSNTTMAQAMAQCGNAKVGAGTAHTGNNAGSIPGCTLVFNGTNKQLVLYARIFASTPADCSNPSTNNGGDTSVTLFGKLKGASGDYGTQLDVDTSATALPLGDFTATIKRGKYASARCHDSNHTWDLKVKHTYKDGVTSTDHLKKKCKVG